MTSNSSQRILFVFTSVSQSLQGDNTGWYLPEAAHPYYILSPHFSIDFASPGGGHPPMDPSSGNRYRDDEECQRFLQDEKVTSRLHHTMRLDSDEIKVNNYRAIYYLGGRGPVIDLPDNRSNIELAEKFYRSGKLVSAVCHGPAALAYVTREDGASIFNGQKATGFSNAEEYQIGRLDSLPFFVEDRIKLLGATYVKADKPWEPCVIQSGNLLTGQNPESARNLAKRMKEVLQNSNA